MSEPEHSILGASSMHRWSRCPGSVGLCETLPPQRSSAYAEEGTEAHAILADMLRVSLGGEVLPADRARSAFQGIPEAVAYAERYLRELVRPGDIVLIEHRVSLRRIDERLYGTADFILYRPSTRALYVNDYKHGAGVVVDVHDNEQLRYYALAACEEFPNAEKIVAGVIQPRIDHPDGWVREVDLDRLDLMEFEIELEAAVDRVAADEPPLVPGDKQCRFCPALALCPAVAARATEAALIDFGATLDGAPQAATPQLLSKAELAERLSVVPLIEKWCAAVRETAYALAESGERLPGWKLVDKQARRSWATPQALRLLIEAGYPSRDLMTECVLKSPAEVEKLVGKKAFAELQATHRLCEAVSSGLALVPESDRRPAVAPPASAQQDFEAMP